MHTSQHTTNSGTYTKSGNTTTTVHSAFDDSGQTTVAAGTLAFSGALVNTGVIAGIGTIETPFSGFTNEGTIAPGLGGAGALSFDGDLALDTDSVLDFELGSLGSFDQLFLSGDITVGGELTLSSIGGYTPMLGDTFTVITFAQSVGDKRFDSVSWNGFGNGLALDVIYNPDNITLAVAAVPEPEQYLMLLAGLGLVGAVARRRRVYL